MNNKLEQWFYGGATKAFFSEQTEAIHQYNTKMISGLLLIMTTIIAAYLVISTGVGVFSKYFRAYLVCCSVLLVMLCTFRLKKTKSVTFTRVYILILASVIFVFVCVLGILYEPRSRATLYIVYILMLPMLLIVPTHYMYSYLSLTTIIFSTMALLVKDITLAKMDIAHAVTCLVIGFFLSHHVLESRMALYALNGQLDNRNLQLDRQLQEKEQQLLQSRISILLSQIQPHFLYNTLTAICGLCDENPKEAKKITANFADYLRHNLETLNQRAPVPFVDELRHTEIYLSIEKKRFEEKLHIVYDIATKEFCVPSLTIQPLVENAVKHGVLRRPTGGTITIATRSLDSCYQITIADDGVGFDTAAPLPEPDLHIGIENVRYRLQSMCQGSLAIASRIGEGTTATITLPKG